MVIKHLLTVMILHMQGYLPTMFPDFRYPPQSLRFPTIRTSYKMGHYQLQTPIKFPMYFRPFIGTPGPYKITPFGTAYLGGMEQIPQRSFFTSQKLCSSHALNSNGFWKLLGVPQPLDPSEIPFTASARAVTFFSRCLAEVGPSALSRCWWVWDRCRCHRIELGQYPDLLFSCWSNMIYYLGWQCWETVVASPFFPLFVHRAKKPWTQSSVP